MDSSLYHNTLPFLSTLQWAVLSVHTLSLLVKTILFASTYTHVIRHKKPPLTWILFFVVIAAAAMEDIPHILSLLHKVWWTSMDYRFFLFIVRLTWSSNIIMYQSLALFIENFTKKHFNLSWWQKTCIGISFICFIVPFTLAFTQFNAIDNRPLFEYYTYQFETFFCLLILMPSALFITWKKLKKLSNHKIIKHQLRALLSFQIVPHIIINFYQAFSSIIILDTLSRFNAGIISQYTNLMALGCSTIFLTGALYFCFKKIVSLRFLNIKRHVNTQDEYSYFTGHLKNILEFLSAANTPNEVLLLTQRFFKQTFGIANQNIKLITRTIECDIPSLTKNKSDKVVTSTTIENFLYAPSDKGTSLLETLQKEKIFIYDEVEYDTFTSQLEDRVPILTFLTAIDADIFLPIYENTTLIAYIIIERNARHNNVYTKNECDKMIVFASYLSKVLNLLQNKNLKELLKQRKDVIEELYLKHQEINQYKESMRSFLHNNEQEIGIIFYKNNKFVFVNQAAENIIAIDPNTYQRHPLYKELKELIQRTLTYNSMQKRMIKNGQGKQIVVSGFPHAGHCDTILVVHYPKLYDTLKEQIDNIKDPSNWDYLLYLETTKSGQLINQLIPGKGSIFLNFKIQLLKAALKKKALLIEAPEEDLLPTVELLHSISLREKLYVLDLKYEISSASTAMQLFGINPLYGVETTTPLLSSLHKIGTLFIKNIDLLDNESQKNLVEFIRYGYYHPFKSEKQIQSDVRIICSSSKNLVQAVHEGSFSQSLFNELHNTSLVMPPLLTLPEQEMFSLVDGFTQQAFSQEEIIQPYSPLSAQEKELISVKRPMSLYELKQRVEEIMYKKEEKNSTLYSNAYSDNSDIATNTTVIKAAQMGKYALKDRKLLQALWDKFQNQSKIALFLGVNRSSVSRRCKEYNIID